MLTILSQCSKLAAVNTWLFIFHVIDLTGHIKPKPVWSFHHFLCIFANTNQHIANTTIKCDKCCSWSLFTLAWCYSSYFGELNSDLAFILNPFQYVTAKFHHPIYFLWLKSSPVLQLFLLEYQKYITFTMTLNGQLATSYNML